MNYFSIEEVSECCGVDIQDVLKWINNGVIKTDKQLVQDDYRVSLDELILFLCRYNRELQATLRLGKKNNHPKVYVIDDEMDVGESIGDVFLDNGFKVVTATNGFTATRLILNQERPLIITLDLTLGTLNGYDFLKIISALNVSDKVWILVISGGSDDSLKKAVDCGADFYLQKPFQKEDLAKIIRKISHQTTRELNRRRG